ncbi:alpha-L-rhamnosidase N-terminal domain-containing protein, partial [Bacillus sp. SIMBA_074]|uniref:alpha-L-rhamnosidase N-terminal domain-containing protein n=1 Tax=Bacillus sp. SIMBA_074 TaxID=3085812 RepID=UPI00397C19F1
FHVSAPVARARLYLTALGIASPFLNGEAISPDLFAPGWTSYEHRIRFHTYDVTPLVREGANELSVILGNGWYRGRVASFHLHRGAVYGD